MLHLLKDYYKNPDEDKINLPILNREYEKSIQDYVVDCFQSISLVLPEIKMTSHKFTVDVYKVNQADYERSRSTKTKEINQKYAYIKESRLGELTMNFDVDVDYEGEHTPFYKTVKMLIPITDKNGYYYIKGNKYLLQYQLTESATYTTSTALVAKSLMPIKMKKRKHTHYDDEANIYYEMNYIQVEVFDRYRSAIYFYLATMGLSNTIEYFSCGKYMQMVDHNEGDPNYTYIKISGNLYVKTKDAYLRNDYIQTILGCILEATNNRTTYENANDKDYWIRKIGAFKSNTSKDTHYELGRRYIILFSRLIDKATLEQLRLTDYNKQDVYAIIRWMIQNFHELWQKDNNDIVYKRLRSTETAASLLNQLISDKIKKFVNTNVNTKEKMINKYKTLLTFRGNEIITKLHSSGLLGYDESVNDMDTFARLKITQKGPNASGDRSDAKTISSRRRALHPSNIGRIDINVCSASNPGLTNYITPLCETDGLYFKGAPPEPELFYENFIKTMNKLDEEGNPEIETIPIAIKIDDYVKFNDVLKTATDCHIYNGIIEKNED